MTEADTTLYNMPTSPIFLGQFDELLLEIVRYLVVACACGERTLQLLHFSAVNRRLRLFVLPYAVTDIIVHRSRAFADSMTFVRTSTVHLTGVVRCGMLPLTLNVMFDWFSLTQVYLGGLTAILYDSISAISFRGSAITSTPHFAQPGDPTPLLDGVWSGNCAGGAANSDEPADVRVGVATFCGWLADHHGLPSPENAALVHLVRDVRKCLRYSCAPG